MSAYMDDGLWPLSASRNASIMLNACYRRASAIVVLACLSAIAAGCSSTARLQSGTLSAGLNCIDDSVRCLAKRRKALDALMADSTGHWIEQPPSPNADASGVRLFGYKKKKRTLTCGQLRIGYAEASSVRTRMRASKSPELTPALISRSSLLGDEVARELKSEMRRRRCA